MLNEYRTLNALDGFRKAEQASEESEGRMKGSGGDDLPAREDTSWVGETIWCAGCSTRNLSVTEEKSGGAWLSVRIYGEKPMFSGQEFEFYSPNLPTRLQAIDAGVCWTAKLIEDLQAIKKELEAEYERCLK